MNIVLQPWPTAGRAFKVKLPFQYICQGMPRFLTYLPAMEITQHLGMRKKAFIVLVEQLALTQDKSLAGACLMVWGAGSQFDMADTLRTQHT